MRSKRRFILAMIVFCAVAILGASFWLGHWFSASGVLLAVGIVLGILALRLATQYRQAQQRLRAALSFQQQLLDRIPIPVFYKNHHGVYLGCNKSYEQFMGLERCRIIGKTVFDIAPPELARIYDEQDCNLLAHPQVQVYECEVKIKAQPSQRNVVFHKATFEDASGQIGGIIGGIMDITERKQADAQRELLITDLRHALDNVKLLSGLVPICASCKKIRDDKGYWNQVEAYLEAHTNASFTHGICPECIEKYYPGLDLEDSHPAHAAR